jgi:very-short-patch-repair endonuclease
MTASERRLWTELRKLDVHFRRQAPIGRYIADFACHAARLVIEVDGGRHVLPEEQLRDAQRDAWLKTIGYRVIRVRDTRAFEEPEKVVAEIAASNSLPPRRGKGRDGGVGATIENVARAALTLDPSE